MKSPKLKAWILAARPRTLLASVVPVIIGTAAAHNDGYINLPATIVALVCSVFIQTGTNYINDLYDFLAGSDSKGRIGPRRALAEGWLTPKEMRNGIVILYTVTFLLGLYLVYVGGWIILLIGVLSLIAGYSYTGGPWPLAYHGLGDLFVFIFFGFVGTIGTYYLITGMVTPLIYWAAVPVGALITNILVVNNYRDREEDKRNNKKTLAVLLGNTFSRYEFIIFIILSYFSLAVIYFFHEESYYIFLPLVTIPLAGKLIYMLYVFSGRELNKTLELSAKFSAIFGLLLAAGLVL